MDISKGFQIEQPRLLIPWGIREAQLRQIFQGHVLRHITDGYYTTSCISLSGLSHELGFHFNPRVGGVLVEYEFFRRSYPDQAASYAEFQRHLEATFGSPTISSAGSEGFPTQVWRIDDAEIAHYVFDRFGPEEHVMIRKKPR